MGIEIKGINVAESTLNNELRIAVLERIIDHLLSRFSVQVNLSPETIQMFREESIEKLRKKYPEANIQTK